MGDESIIITIVGAVVTTIISTVVLRSMKFFEKRQDEKAKEVRETAAHAAEQAQTNAVKIAEEIIKKQDERSKVHIMTTAQITEDLKTQTKQRDEMLNKSLLDSTERIAIEFRENTARIAEDLRIKTDQQSKAILDRITAVNSRLTEMIDSLKEGAELTNNNVANIRRDMLELQEDVDNIYDKINREDIDKDPSMKAERDRKRKIRRREINNDSLVYEGPRKIDKSSS